MTDFTFTRVPGFMYLTVRPGCHVRADQIVAITAGTGFGDEREDTVFVHLASGSFATFEPCPTPEEARGMTLDLLDALAKAPAAVLA